ncbi:MAG: hypothetical protein RBQ81_08415 [Arcobacteraceae bacterium]|jgi:hypothetical protein|nr:hypothetical protein [Arcobacteraceae bacterium]
MFGFLFRSATYIIIWKLFKSQILSLLASVVVIIFICQDLYKIFSYDKEILLMIVALKWIIIIVILIYNIYVFKKVKTENRLKDNYINEEITNEELPIISKKILNKKGGLLTKSDLILQKYIKQKGEL